jgi:regulator of sigma E protease
MSVLLAILGLAILIIVHEAGHMVVARLCGMRVERFSVGFGNALVSFKRGGTIYQLAPIPLGGFVQITGMNPHEEFDHNDPYVYPNRPRWMRFLVLLAGPGANYLTAIVLTFVMLLAYGQYVGTNQIDKVVADSAAQAAGVQAGDVVASVNGQPVAKAEQVIEVICGWAAAADQGQQGQGCAARVGAPQGQLPPPLRFELLRNGARVPMEITPRPGGSQGGCGYVIGVAFHQVPVTVGVGAAAKGAVVGTVVGSIRLVQSLWDVITRRVKGGLTGPIGIAKEMASAAKQGLADFISILIMISVALGVFNLLPLPGLDGGRIFFVGINSIRRRDMNPATETKIHMVGIMALLAVLVLVSFNDVRRIFFK